MSSAESKSRATWSPLLAMTILTSLIVLAVTPGCGGSCGCGRKSPQRKSQPDAESYDASADRWRAVAPLPFPVAGARAVAVGGRIYVVGGGDVDRQWEIWPFLQRYDPVSDVWERLEDLPAGRAGYGVTVVGSEIFVVGGVTDSQGAVTFDTISESWGGKPNIPNPHSRMGAVSIGSTVYVPGGDTDLFDAYDSGSGTWFPLAPLPVPLSNATTVTNGFEIFVLGGQDPSASSAVLSDEHWIYDVATDSWSAGPTIPEPGHHFRAAIDGARIYLFGAHGALTGRALVGDERQRVLVLNSVSLLWAEAKPRRKDLYDSAVTVEGGILYAFGGWSRPRRR